MLYSIFFFFFWWIVFPLVVVSNIRSTVRSKWERYHHAVKLNHVESTQFIFKNEFLSYPITQLISRDYLFKNLQYRGGTVDTAGSIKYLKKNFFFCFFNAVRKARIYDSSQSIIKRFLGKPGFKDCLILRNH